jgi:C4-dicarboxylate-specific signal transduction histidine kinase
MAVLKTFCRNEMGTKGKIATATRLPAGGLGLLGWRIKRDGKSQLWRSVVRWLAGAMGLGSLAFGCFMLGSNLATAAFALLILIALLSLQSSFIGSVVLSVVAVACLNYFFARPIFSFRVANIEDLVLVAAFLTTSIIITGLSAKVRALAKRELEQVRAELARFARVATLGELTASIAHEVNQPLAGVVSSGNACQRWLASEPPNIERANQSLDRIIRDANRASQVVERVLGLARKTPPNKAHLSINDAVQEIIALTRGEIERNRVLLRTQLSDDLPMVLADRIQLQQVLLNLITNAVEALGVVNDGRRDMLVTTALDGTDSVLFAVEDTGEGLDSETLQNVFDAFYTTKREGIGMGLAVSRSIIEAHGGRLWASLNEPRGALFQLTLPAV